MSAARGTGPGSVVVAGGGIGGLATAIALAGRGHEVTVCERNAEFAELGAGIQLAPNGMHALDRLGLGEAVERIAVPVTELRFMDAVAGRHVTSLPLDEAYRARFGKPYVVVHRGELHRLLVAACRDEPRVRLCAGTAVTAYRRVDGGVEALLRSGAALRADALVGADGLHSAVRAQVVGDGAPRPAGITVYRTTIPMDRVPPELRDRAVTWWTGPGRHFVHYPIAGGRFLNLAPSVENDPAEGLAGAPVPARTVLEQFSMLCEKPRRLLELGTEWKAWGLVDRDPVADWTDGPVVLTGDAAHPVLHYAAQGACLALEDAVALGELAHDRDGLAAGFRAFTRLRRDRTARVHRLARASIDLWHAAGAGADARDAALAAMTPTDLREYVAWLHGEGLPVVGLAPRAPVPHLAPASARRGTFTAVGYLPAVDDLGWDWEEPDRGSYTLGGYLPPSA